MIIGARLKERIEAAGGTQLALAKAIGVTPQAISKMVNGNTTETAKLYQIARFLRTTPEYLTGESDDPRPSPTDEHRGPYGELLDDDDQPEMVWIKEAKLDLGLGGSYLSTHVEERKIPFPKDWLRQFSDAPPHMLVFVRGRGTSMEPTVRDGDICLIDLSRRRIDEQDELWALAYGELGMVKRLRAMPDGTVKIMSDNQSVRDEHATDGELHVIGRCSGVFRKT